MAPDETISAIRSFNRFYTSRVGLLDDRYLGSAFSLTEGRVLYELASRAGLTASDLVRDLGVDAGYLSRILRRFEARGLIKRMPVPEDRRRATLALTEAGRAAFAPLDEAARQQVSAMLDAVPPAAQSRLAGAMRTIEALLSDTAPSAEAGYVLRAPLPGDMGWIVHRHGVLYAQEQGWDARFEALVAEIVAGFAAAPDTPGQRCWIAERGGAVVGSIFAMRESDETARLRLLYVEPSARGLGIGARLVRECIDFARDSGYRRLTLWTNDVLVSARRIYEAAGFRLHREERHASFGHDLVGQYWELSLNAGRQDST